MNTKRHNKALLRATVAGFCTIALTQATHVEAADWALGDVFAGIASGSYKVFDNAGVFKETISDGLGGFTTGCAFNPALDKLYTTNFSSTKVPVYDDAHPHAIGTTIDTNATSPGGHSESIVFAADGSFYVGHADGNRDIHHYDAAGVLVGTFDVATEARGSDWIELAADQMTIFYTSEGGLIKRFDVSGAGAQLPDFAAIGGTSFALRLLPPGDGSGGLLVANSGDIKRLDGLGAVVQTYDAPGENAWFSLNRDPNGTSFWAGSFDTNNFYRFNIATGAVEVGPIASGGSLFGLCLKGELTTVGDPCDGDPPDGAIVGTPGPDALLGTPGDDVIFGLDGNDGIAGLGGNDLICAGPGNDAVHAGAGDDTVGGGDGNDAIYGQGGADTLNGNAGNDAIEGGDGDDTIKGGNGDDAANGGAGDDAIDGGDGNDAVNGGSGNDVIDSGDGDDAIAGGTGDDTINGGNGKDTANGGTGSDTVNGGDDDDTLNVIDGVGGNDTVDGGAHVAGDICAADPGDTVIDCNP